MRHASTLIRAGVKPRDIGIITPYNAQVTLIRELRSNAMNQIEVSSVDGFQGAYCLVISIDALGMKCRT